MADRPVNNHKGIAKFLTYKGGHQPKAVHDLSPVRLRGVYYFAESVSSGISGLEAGGA